MAHVKAAHVKESGALFLDQRRRAVVYSLERVGLDFVSVRRLGETERGVERWQLELCFLPAGAKKQGAGRSPAPRDVAPRNLRVTLGDLVDPGVRVKSVAPGAGAETLVAEIHRDPPSIVSESESTESLPVYTLELVELPEVDRFFQRASFVFKDGGLELGPGARIPPIAEPRELPEIDYLAKDYESFRQLMLERIQTLVPSWREGHAADVGVTVVELLAHAADYLSYYQDAVATEAYIATARRRISVRRHARLVDYRLHEGCNARCWVQLKVDHVDCVDSRAGCPLPEDVELLTYTGRIPGVVERGSQEHRRALERDPLIYRVVDGGPLHPEHNRIAIYTWGVESFSLPAGTTQAALVGRLDHLRAGDVLVFERREEPDSESADDVDPRDRQIVRLCRPPQLGEDLAAGGRAGAAPVAITEVEWFAEDALQSDFPVSARVGGVLKRDLTVVRGNLVLVDHGSICQELLEPVPAGGRYVPKLARHGLTHRVPYDAEEARLEPARGSLAQDPRAALPDVELYELTGKEVADHPDGLPVEALRASSRPRWSPRHDLLASRRFAHDFVVELDDAGVAHLRFGDDQHGQRPSPGTVFQAVYRVGTGPAGNLGAYALRHAVVPAGAVARGEVLGFRLRELKNHLAGGGGLDREPKERARLFAPEALRARGSLERCVTEADYAEIAERHPDVLKAAARLRWNGSWNLAELYVQRPGDRPVDPLFARRLQRFMAPYLLAGWELQLSSPSYVPLDLRLAVWADPSVERENLRQKLRGRVAAGDVEFLRPGFFTFGKPVYLSEVIAQVMALPEVVDVRVDVFQRWGQASRGELEEGEIPILPLEIAQIDNDLQAPHRGVLRVTIGGAE